MRKNIEVDAAKKLAGLQIDLLQKFRNEHFNTRHLTYLLGLTKEELDTLTGATYFEYVTSLRIIVPSKDEIIQFIRENWEYGERFLRAPYPDFLESGKKLRIKIFRFERNLHIDDMKEPDPRMVIDFIKNQKGQLPTIYGLASAIMQGNKTIFPLLEASSGWKSDIAGIDVAENLPRACDEEEWRSKEISIFQGSNLSGKTTSWVNWNAVRYMFYFC
jgi:hypothetical protein